MSPTTALQSAASLIPVARVEITPARLSRTRQRLPGNRIEGYASALAADGKIYNVTGSNGTFVLAAKPEFEQLANNLLDPDRSTCNASPAVAGGQLLLRSNQALYCIGSTGK